MKFFYAIMVFVLSAYIFFWASIFVIPTPEVYKIGDITSGKVELNEPGNDTYNQAIFESKKGKDEDTLIFKSDLDKKRGSALFIGTLVTFVVIFFQIILFHKRSHILFPLIAATVVAYIGFSILWVGNGSIAKETYANFMTIKENFPGFKALQFLGQYLVVFLLILLFGNWYKLNQV